MDLIHDKAKIIAEELFLKNPLADDVMFSVDREKQYFNSVCFGGIENRTPPCNQDIAYYVVHELEQRCRKKKATIHWPQNYGLARAYAKFKKQNFLE